MKQHDNNEKSCLFPGIEFRDDMFWLRGRRITPQGVVDHITRDGMVVTLEILVLTELQIRESVRFLKYFNACVEMAERIPNIQKWEIKNAVRHQLRIACGNLNERRTGEKTADYVERAKEDRRNRGHHVIKAVRSHLGYEVSSYVLNRYQRSSKRG